MSTFALIHGAGGSGWEWHLVEAELRARGHRTVAPDLPAELAAQALAQERAHPSMAAYVEPWPLDRWPDVPTRFVLCSEDRLFPADFLQSVVRDRLGVTPHTLKSGHCPTLAHPRPLARLLEGPGSVEN